MKLSEMTSEQGVDVLIRLTPVITGLLSDSEFISEVTGILADKSEDGKELRAEDYLSRGIEKINNLAFLLFRKKRDALFEIIGAVGGKSAAQVASQSFIVTLSEARDILRDKDLINFLKSCAGTEKNG